FVWPQRAGTSSMIAMAEDSNLLLQIKKLHLLPATIYIIGAALIAAALLAKLETYNIFFGLAGAGLMFAGVTLHMVVDAVRVKLLSERTVFWVQIALAAALAIVCLALAWAVFK